MPLKRKLIRTTGNSYQIFLPKDWVENKEQEKGEKMVGFNIMLNGNLRATPIFESEWKKIKDSGKKPPETVCKRKRWKLK